MPRLKSDFRITIKDSNTGQLHKIELIKLLINGEHKKAPDIVAERLK